MVDETYIPDDVIMEAFNIMRRHSPQLAPYIGQLPPATQHLISNSNEAALVPYIPPDKISVNIHHIDGHWITSVFRPQNNTVCIYDSLRRSDRIKGIKKDLTILYGANLNIQYPKVTQQLYMPDCGAFAIAYAFSALLGIPPETQVYNINSMRTHLKTVLQSGNLIPFPVSRESHCISDYFVTQAKLLSKKQTTAETVKPILHNATPMNRRRVTRREYMKTYMHRSRSEETTKQRQERNQKKKCKMQTLRAEETTKQRHDRNQKNKVNMQTLRAEETTKQRHDRNQKNKVNMQTLRTEETTKQRHDRNQKNKVNMQTLRTEETTEQRQDRKQKDKVHKQIFRSKETVNQKHDRNQKNKMHLQKQRGNVTASQKSEYNEKIKNHIEIARRKESVEKKQMRSAKTRKYFEELLRKETPAERINRRLKVKERIEKYRGNQKSYDKSKVKHNDKEHKRYVQKLRLEQRNYNEACETFRRLSRAGPKYACTVCRRLLYKQSVKNISSKTFSKTSVDLLKLCFAEKVSSYVCSTCSRHLASNRLPPMSVANKMSLKPIPECLHDLTELEERLVAQRIPFMKIMNLPKGKQKAIIGQVVNVPVDTAETVAALPRTANSSGFIPLKLKRKQSYPGHVLYQMIRPHKVEAALKYLVDHNEHYQNILLNEEWQKEFENEDEELWDALVEPRKENTDNLNVTEENDETVTPSTTPDKEENNLENVSELEVNDTDKGEVASNSHQEEESLRGLQYNTCIQPDDLANYLGNEVYSVAPGEGRLPLLIGNDANNEVLTFPTLFPDGKFGFDVQRMSKLTLRKYFQAKLLSEDTRFAKNTEYLFYAQYLKEQKQISDSINIALRKAKLSVTDEDRVTAGTLKNTERLKQLILQDQGQRFVQNVRGSLHIVRNFCQIFLQ